MLGEVTGADGDWFRSGQEVFPAMLAAIDAAQRSVGLETYIYSAGSLGERFRAALVRARQRGARVHVLVDALGSYGLPAAFWQPLQAVGGEVRQFNPLALRRLGIRDHRKVLVCDHQVAFIGGFNIAPECEGDGVSRGWCDVGLRVRGALAGQLAASFDEMFARADFRHRPFSQLRKSPVKQTIPGPGEQLLLSGPGRGLSPMKQALRRDLRQARAVQIMTAYFLPTWRLRRQLATAARRGARVQLLLAGKSDVAVSLLAARSLYRRLLNSGVEIYEYQPQILHAKLLLLDDVVYVGSANLDQRSLHLNYEFMVRLESPALVTQARDLFANRLQYCRKVDLASWRQSHTLWRRLKEYWAYFLLVRIDPYIARWQWRGLPD